MSKLCNIEEIELTSIFVRRFRLGHLYFIHLISVPGRITGAYCDDGKNQDTRTGFEGYVTPGFPINYRIHSLFLENTEEVRLKVVTPSTLHTTSVVYEHVTSVPFRRQTIWQIPRCRYWGLLGCDAAWNCVTNVSEEHTYLKM